MAFLGVALGYYAPFVYGLVVLRHVRESGETDERHGFLPIIKESVVNSQALFAYFALTNIDMIVGRSILDPHDSGLYAAGPDRVARGDVPAAVRRRHRVPVDVHQRQPGSRAASPAWRSSAAWARRAWWGRPLLPDLVLVFAGGQDYGEVRGAAVGVRPARHLHVGPAAAGLLGRSRARAPPRWCSCGWRSARSSASRRPPSRRSVVCSASCSASTSCCSRSCW